MPVLPSYRNQSIDLATHALNGLMLFILPPYQRLIWDYKIANVGGTLKSLNSVNWGFVLSDKSVHQQVQYLNEILMNVFYNYIPNKWIKIDDKDLPWMDEEIENNINYRNTFLSTAKKV